MPAISPAALPRLRQDLAIAEARVALGNICAATFARDVENLHRKIVAAESGADTWTDTNGSVWGAQGLLVGGTVPKSGLWFGGAGF